MLELDEMLVVGVGELSLEPPLAQPQEKLARCFERDLLLVLQRVELGEQRRQLGVGRLLTEQVCPRAAVQLVVEVLRPEQLEVRQQRLVTRDAGQGAALEPFADIEKPMRDDPGGTRTASRRERRLRLGRQVEKVGREAPTPPDARANRAATEGTIRSP